MPHPTRIILTGFTGRRGTAWAGLREETHEGEPTTYFDEVPVEDVTRRLFDWDVHETPELATWPDGSVRSTGDKVLIRPPGVLGPDDEGGKLGTFTPGYSVHGYQAWLVEQQERIMSGRAAVGVAGLVKSGGAAFVQFEVAENIDLADLGMEFRPYFTAISSLDGSFKSTFVSGATLVICDNMVHRLGGLKVGIKHTSRSAARLGTVRADLELEQVASAYAAQSRDLSRVDVSDAAWEAFLDAHKPLTDATGEPKTGKSLTMATKERDALTRLYKTDPRNPWTGTALGVVQALNTHAQHEATVKNADRLERNSLNMMDGSLAKGDQHTLDLLTKVLATI